MSGAAVVDGLGRQVVTAVTPRRIVSLVPSATETLAAFGVAEHVVGRTRYCVHPRPWVETVPSVGGTKSPKLDAIAALRPDLILANQEENRPALWPELEALAPLYVAYPRTIDEALDDLDRVGRLVGAEGRSAELRRDVHERRAQLAMTAERAFRYAYLIWFEPWMTVSDDTFIADMLRAIGGTNVFAAREPRYAEVTRDELVAADPDVVFLPSEPFAFEARHADSLGPLRRRATFIDGEMTSWHGARMVEALPYLASLPLPPAKTG